jgi:F-box and leucine-rich repeat protein 10/11
LRDIKGGSEYSPRLLASLLHLAYFLVQEARILERGSESARRESEDQIPKDKIKDAPALARELRWRLQAADGILSEEDEPSYHLKKVSIQDKRKRKRTESETSHEEQDQKPFRHFRPRLWDKTEEKKQEEKKETVKARKTGDDWEIVIGEEESSIAELSSQMYVLKRLRRTEGGIERETIERKVEKFVWS